MSNIEKILLLDIKTGFSRGSSGDRVVWETPGGDISSENPNFCLGAGPIGGGGRFRPEDVAGIEENDVDGCEAMIFKG